MSRHTAARRRPSLKVTERQMKAPLWNRRLRDFRVGPLSGGEIEDPLCPDCDYFQVLRRDDGDFLSADVGGGPQVFESAAERGRFAGIQGCEGAVCRPVILAEELDHIRGRKWIAEGAGAVLHPDFRRPGAQALAHNGFLSPKYRGRHTRG